MIRRRYRRTSGRSGVAGGGEVSRQTTRPPGRTTRACSRKAPDAVGDVAQQVAGGHGVEAGVGKRQRQRVGGAPGDAVAARPPPPDPHHLEREVGRRDARAGIQPQRLQGDVARAARQIEQPPARRQRRREHHGAPPGPVAPERHQGVHELITSGDAVEHRPHVGRRRWSRGRCHRRDSRVAVMAGADCTRAGRSRATSAADHGTCRGRGSSDTWRVSPRAPSGVESRGCFSPREVRVHDGSALSLFRPRPGRRGVFRRGALRAGPGARSRGRQPAPLPGEDLPRPDLHAVRDGDPRPAGRAGGSGRPGVGARRRRGAQDRARRRLRRAPAQAGAGR